MNNSVENARMTAVKGLKPIQEHHFLQKKIPTEPARKCGFEQGRQLWVGSHRTGHCPRVFPMKLQFGLAFRGLYAKWLRLQELRDLRKKILADNKLFNLLSFPVAIFCLKKKKKSKWKECEFSLMRKAFCGHQNSFHLFNS